MSPGAELLPVLLSLVFILLLFVTLARLLPRWLQKLGPGENAGRVQSCLAVGQKERVVIVQYAGETLLLGVAPGRVSLLKTLPSQNVADGSQAPRRANKE